MSGPNDWIRRILSPTEAYQLRDVDWRPNGWRDPRVDRDLDMVGNIAVAGLIGMGLLTYRRKWWLFGPKGVAITRKGRKWAGWLKMKGERA